MFFRMICAHIIPFLKICAHIQGSPAGGEGTQKASLRRPQPDEKSVPRGSAVPITAPAENARKGAVLCVHNV